VIIVSMSAAESGADFECAKMPGLRVEDVGGRDSGPKNGN
jgi:hypothetical protein